jgi:hypothetical protein
MFEVFALIVVGTAIWVGFDASQREWTDGFSTAAWVAGVLLLWIVIFPYYLVRRSKAPLKASDPVGPAVTQPPAPPSPAIGNEPRFQQSPDVPHSPLTVPPVPEHAAPTPFRGLTAPCVNCGGPIESHYQVFGSKQCEACTTGRKARPVLAHATAAETEPSHTVRNVILAISGAVVLTLVGCSMLVGQAVDDATAIHNEVVHVYAPSGGCWSGAIGDSTKDGCGSLDIPISQSGPIAAANAQKQDDGDWELSLGLEVNGKIVDTSSTTAEYGIAEVSGGDF